MVVLSYNRPRSSIYPHHPALPRSVHVVPHQCLVNRFRFTSGFGPVRRLNFFQFYMSCLIQFRDVINREENRPLLKRANPRFIAFLGPFAGLKSVQMRVSAQKLSSLN